MAGAAAAAGQAPQVPAAPATPARDTPPAAGDSAPAATGPVTPVGKAASDARADEDLMEFLGADDVGAAEWELLKKSAPAKAQRPMPPPQDATS